MEIIFDEEKLNKYIELYNIDDLFTESYRKYMSLYRWNKGEYICKEGEKLNYMFFLTQGKAKVYKNFENGKSLLLCFYTPFKIIGDVEFTKNRNADCSVQAIQDIYAVGISLDIVRKKLLEDSKFLLNMCNYLCEKLTKNSTNSSINLLYPLENRLASYILAYVSDDYYIKKSKKIKFEFEGSYNEIAELLGTSYRHLNRTLNKMCQDNVLEKMGKAYGIKNIERLEMLCGDLYK